MSADEITDEVLEAAVERLEVPSLCDLRDRGGSFASLNSDRDSEAEGSGYATPDVGGASSELNEFEEPNEELVETIVKQCEFYFSDANILKDQFLLKHVRRNKEGWVSLKLIACFRRMKRLTRDYRQVMVALRKSSTTLEVSEDGAKVRRKEPLPAWDETVFSRTIVLSNFPNDQQPSFDWVGNQVSAFGEPLLVRFVKPDKELPADLKNVASRHADLGQKLCAVVEFDNHESADKACRSLNAENAGNWRSCGLRARLLKIPKTESSPGPSTLTPSPRDSPRAQRRSPESSARPRASTGPNESRLSPHPSRTRSPMGSPRLGGRRDGGSPVSSSRGTPQGSPWSSPSLRRRALANGTTTGDYIQLQRQPFGPDGSKGFQK